MRDLRSDTGSPASNEAIPIYRVSDLVADLRAVCAEAFGLVWVEGEISGLHRSRLGHVYFELKDEGALLRAVLFRSVVERLPLTLSDGMHVRVRAQPDLYPERGQLQLIVDQVQPAGEGALALALARLKQRLKDEGLFDAAHKRPLPSCPRRIGLVTSLGGAAIHDFVRVLRRRRAAVDVVVYDARVQGEDAWRSLVRGLHLLAADSTIEVIVLARGGGSLQDLWTFNREELVRAIFALTTPVISAVGHETDTMLSDWVADARAATPTAAADLVTGDGGALANRLRSLANRLESVQRARLHAWALRLRGIERGLIHPRARLQAARLRLNRAQRTLGRIAGRSFGSADARLTRAAARLQAGVNRRLERDRGRLRASAETLFLVAEDVTSRASSRLGTAAARLEALSPLRVLARGYGIARRERDGAILRSSRDVEVGEPIQLTLSEGRLTAVVAPKSEP